MLGTVGMLTTRRKRNLGGITKLLYLSIAAEATIDLLKLITLYNIKYNITTHQVCLKKTRPTKV